MRRLRQPKNLRRSRARGRGGARGRPRRDRPGRIREVTGYDEAEAWLMLRAERGEDVDDVVWGDEP